MLIFIGILCVLSPRSTQPDSGNNDLVPVETICAQIEADLVRIGFENITVRPDKDSSITIIYENRRFRSAMRALGRVCQSVSALVKVATPLLIIIRQRAIPVVAFKVSSKDLHEFVVGNMAEATLRKRLLFVAPGKYNSHFENVPLVAPSFRKLDIELEPIIDSNLGNREDPFKFKLDLQVAGMTLLRKGLFLRASARLPIFDEINASTKESVRLYDANVSYIHPIGKDLFFSGHAGYFLGQRYGFSAQVARYLLQGNIGMSARLDFTGFLTFDDGKWYYSDPNLWTYRVGGYAQFTRYGFLISAHYERFLRGDRGVRVSLGRYLRESRLEFFGIASTGDRWAGIELHIPLFPNKRFRPSKVRFNLPNLYTLKYDYLTTDFGESFEASGDLNMFRSTLTKNYILNHLYELR